MLDEITCVHLKMQQDLMCLFKARPLEELRLLFTLLPSWVMQ